MSEYAAVSALLFLALHSTQRITQSLLRSLLGIFLRAVITQKLPQSSRLLQSLLSNRAHQVFVFAAREHGFDKGAAQLLVFGW